MKRRSVRLLIGTLLAYVLLVAPHEGEFWPFSIFPMFSQAGGEWSRAVVRELPSGDIPPSWRIVDRDELPGTPFALREHGLRHDLANFIARTETWDEPRVQGLRRMFYDQLETRNLMVYRVRGSLTEADSVTVRFEPYAYLSADTTILRPDLLP